jgi:hypothetical protein
MQLKTRVSTRDAFNVRMANRPQGLALETGRCSTQPDTIQQFATAEGVLLTQLGTNLTTLASGVLTLLQEINNSGGTISVADQASLTAAIAQTQTLVTQAGAISTVQPVAAPPAS